MRYKFPDGFHPNQYKDKKIGLLGGSFNPAHRGHLELSLKAKRFFGFDEIWWVINPQNPLKPVHITRHFNERFEYCHMLTKNYSYIKPCSIEYYNQTNMTYQLVNFLKTYYFSTHFVWLMGSDLVGKMHYWENYQLLINNFSFIIYYRDSHFYSIKQSRLLNQLKRKFLPLDQARYKIFLNKPRWTIFPYLYNPISSSEIRKNMI